jgi:hypothetical protein
MRTKEANFWAAQDQRWHDQWIEAQRHIDELESAIAALELIALKNIDNVEVRDAVKKLVDSVFRGARQ